MTIQRQIVRLVAVVVVPAGIAAALLIGYSYERQRAFIAQQTLETARALTQAVDRELASGQVGLQVLAKSSLLATGDLAMFHREARHAILDMPGSAIAVSDGTGQQLLNTLFPFGASLPPPNPENVELVRRVFETGKPVVSDLLKGAVVGRPVIALGVPVTRDNRVHLYLSMGVFPDRLGEILTRQALPAGWVASIFDSQGTIVARTHDQARYVGQKGAPELVRRMGQAREGRLDVDTLEGIPVVAVFSRSKVSNWSVAIGIPRATLWGLLWIPMLWIVGGTVALLSVGIVLARGIASRIAGSVRGLIAPARALGRGEPIVVPPLSVVEADEVGRELVRAGEALRDRERVLAVVSHDLRNPLSGLMLNAAYAERLAARLPEGKPVSARIAALTDIARRMSGMVDDLLSVAVSTGGGRAMLKLAPTNAASLLAEAAESARPIFEREGIELQIDADGALPDILADPDRVLRVFANLLDNALKFTKRPGRVVLRAEAQPDGVQFSVANSGPALSAEQLERMFTPFWQAGNDDARGAGLGMSICSSIIEAHGGSIWAEPQAGERVRICFVLPRAEGPALSRPEARPPIAAVH